MISRSCSFSLTRALLLCAAVAPTPMAQPINKAQRFERLTDDQAVASKPLGSRPITVVLKLDCDPFTVVRGRGPNKQLSEGEQGAVENQLRQQQDALVPII